MSVPTTIQEGNSYRGISLLDTAPKETDFTALADHAASTPASYSLDTDPVLHYDVTEATLRILGDGFGLLPVPSSSGSGNNSQVFTQEEADLQGVPCQVKIASSHVFVWFPRHGFGYVIAYPSITLHGIASPTSIYLQVSPAPSGSDETEFAELYLEVADSQPVYDALCTCAGLHADPESEDEAGNGGGGGVFGGGIALDLDVDMDLGLEDYEAGGDDDGWTKNGHAAANSGPGSGDNGDENEDVKGERAGLEIAIEDDESVKAGVRRRRSDGLDVGETNGTSEGKQEQTGSAEKWRRTS